MFVFDWLSTVITIAAGIGGFLIARTFVRRRLRFVDSVYSPFAPVIAGAIAWLVAWPVAILPLITVTASALFGIGAGFGTASGVKALKRGN
ncbi:MAG: hypothetical protein AB7Q69_04145 [Gemmatimonadales bacterium]